MKIEIRCIFRRLYQKNIQNDKEKKNIQNDSQTKRGAYHYKIYTQSFWWHAYSSKRSQKKVKSKQVHWTSTIFHAFDSKQSSFLYTYYSRGL